MANATETRITEIPEGTWSLDPVHSTVGFAVEHGLGTFRGGFKDFEVSLDADRDEPRFTGTVRVDSIAIDQEDLRGHLLSPEFFDVEKHPEIKFESTSIRVDDGGQLVVEGGLTINGVTKAVEGRGEVKGPIVTPAGPAIAINLETTVDRRDYGLDWQMQLPNGEDVLGYDVTLSVNLELQGEE